jgi:soluble lytic murein transglycosylase
MSSNATALLRLGACLILLCAASARSDGAQRDVHAASRADFQQAIARLADSPVELDARDSARLRRYLLYPYLQAARLSKALREAENAVPPALDERIAAFLEAHDAQPVAEELRRNWLASLAARAQWARYLAIHREPGDGPALRCHGFTARIETQRTQDLAEEIARAFLSPRSQPECERAFEWLRTTGGLTDLLLEQRVRLALQAGNPSFARELAQSLPAERAAPLLQWVALLEDPRREIDALIGAPRRTVDADALLAGWTRLARTDRAAAKARFAPFTRARGLDRDAASPFALALALPLSWDRDPETLAYFARVAPAHLDDPAREWQARAALWAGDWIQVSTSIGALSEENRGSARWRYWAARAAERSGDEPVARALYESILPSDNYYAAMAAARLDRPASPNEEPVPPDPKEQSRVERQPAFTRARELRLSGLDSAARTEWRAGLETLEPPARLQAIHVAARWEWYDQAIVTAAGERVFNDYALLYPRPYESQVRAAAQLTGLRPEILFGIVRQESLYRSDAVSSADARGLMQLLPETARRTAVRWKQPIPTAVSLFDPQVNVTLGAGQLQMLLERFDGQLPAALAGYNAGPGAALRWLPIAPIDPDIWIENIPYNETRNYVQRVLWHSLVFTWLKNRDAQVTRDWLRPVSPVPAIERPAASSQPSGGPGRFRPG